MLELALEREQASNLTLRSAALANGQETTLLHDRLAALTTQSRAQLESIQDLQAKLYSLQGQLEGYEVQRRMQQSRRVLDQLQLDQPVAALAPAAVSGVPTKTATAAALASASSSLSASTSASFTASSAAASASSADPQTAAALRLLQSELTEERRLVTELRALYSLSHDTERSLRAQLIASTDFSLGLQKSLKSAQASHRSLSEENLETQTRLLRIERDYHRALREVRYANQLLRAQGGGEESQELDTPSPSLSPSSLQHHPTNQASSSYHALHFAATSPDEDEITQITNAARSHAPPPLSKAGHDRSRELAAERDRPAQQQPSRFR